jgi:hypothetical protein
MFARKIRMDELSSQHRVLPLPGELHITGAMNLSSQRRESIILEFCDDLTLGTICGTTCAPGYQEVRDEIAHRPVSKYRY